jgi:hypothetical protein
MISTLRSSMQFYFGMCETCQNRNHLPSSTHSNFVQLSAREIHAKETPTVRAHTNEMQVMLPLNNETTGGGGGGDLRFPHHFHSHEATRPTTTQRLGLSNQTSDSTIESLLVSSLGSFSIASNAAEQQDSLCSSMADNLDRGQDSCDPLPRRTLPVATRPPRATTTVASPTTRRRGGKFGGGSVDFVKTAIGNLFKSVTSHSHTSIDTKSSDGSFMNVDAFDLFSCHAEFSEEGNGSRGGGCDWTVRSIPRYEAKRHLLTPSPASATARHSQADPSVSANPANSALSLLRSASRDLLQLVIPQGSWQNTSTASSISILVSSQGDLLVEQMPMDGSCDNISFTPQIHDSMSTIDKHCSRDHSVVSMDQSLNAFLCERDDDDDNHDSIAPNRASLASFQRMNATRCLVDTCTASPLQSHAQGQASCDSSLPAMSPRLSVTQLSAEEFEVSKSTSFRSVGTVNSEIMWDGAGEGSNLAAMQDCVANGKLYLKLTWHDINIGQDLIKERSACDRPVENSKRCPVRDILQENRCKESDNEFVRSQPVEYCINLKDPPVADSAAWFETPLAEGRNLATPSRCNDVELGTATALECDAKSSFAQLSHNHSGRLYDEKLETVDEDDASERTRSSTSQRDWQIPDAMWYADVTCPALGPNLATLKSQPCWPTPGTAIQPSNCIGMRDIRGKVLGVAAHRSATNVSSTNPPTYAVADNGATENLVHFADAHPNVELLAAAPVLHHPFPPPDPAPQTLPNSTITNDKITVNDVLFADGGEERDFPVIPYCRSHPGNVTYNDEVRKWRAAYAISLDAERLAIRRDLIKLVKDRRGRFLKFNRDTTNQWIEIKDKPVHTQLKDDLHIKIYIHPDNITELDFLEARGGEGNKHPGNRAYLDQKDMLRHAYKSAKTSQEKHQISMDLVHWLQARGGRFLKQDVCGRWYIQANEITYAKAKQKLNEARKRAVSIN